MQQLIFWATNGYNEFYNKYIPHIGKYDIEEQLPKSKSDMEWMNTFLADEELPSLPEHIYFIVKSIKKIEFECYEYSARFLIVSEKLLQFMHKYGYSSGYDYCPAFIVSTKGVLLTEEKFFLLRIFKTTIAQHTQLIKFEQPLNAPSKYQIGQPLPIYASISTESEQKIFSISKPASPSLLFAEDLVPEIKATFKYPYLYSATEWIDSMQQLADS